MSKWSIACKMGCGAVATIGFVLLFAAGVLIDHRGTLATLHSYWASSVQSQTPIDIASRFEYLEFMRDVCLSMPLNVALLALLSGFIGGCASNITYSCWQSGEQTTDRPAGDPRVFFRSENPVASMLRSLVVYLAFVAGVFIVDGAPIDSPTIDQYVRFASTVSFFAFVVGYDPTKVKDFLKYVSRDK